MNDVTLHPDCTQCAALCCVALAFDKSPQFKINKIAGEKCLNLNSKGLCNIHGDLEGGGFKGCVLFDCQGAGQHVTQKLFQGRSWQNDPSILKPMMEAFWSMRRVHEQIVLLREAEKLSLPPDKRTILLEYADALQPAKGWSIASLDAFINGPTLNDIRSFLSTLGDFVTSTKEH